MLLTIDHRCVDTDYPEDYIEQIKTLLPYSLGESIADRLTEYKTFEDKLSESYSEGQHDETNLDNARDVRDKVQGLLDNLIENSSFDKDTISAIKYIKRELDNI